MLSVFLYYAITVNIYIIVYSSPLIYAGLLFSATFLRREPKGKLLVLLVTVSSMTFLAEMFLNYQSYSENAERREAGRRLISKTAARLGYPPDTRTKVEIVAGLRAEGKDAFPFLGAREVNVEGRRVLAIGGVSDATTVQCNESGAPVVYRSDEHGFNNQKGTWKWKIVDIVLVGDSFTLGYCVPSDRNLAGIIRRKGFRVVNLGVAGSLPIHYLAAMREYLFNFQPKHIFFVYYEGNDFYKWRDFPELPSGVAWRYLDAGFTQGLAFFQKDLDKALKEQYLRGNGGEIKSIQQGTRDSFFGSIDIKELVVLGKLRGLVGLNPYYPSILKRISERNLRQGDNPEDATRSLDLLLKVISAAKSEADKSRGEFHFVYIPSLVRYWPRFDEWQRRFIEEMGIRPAKSDGTPYKDRVVKAVRELGISVIDVEPAFGSDERPQDLFHSIRSHYSEEGYEVVAREMTAVINR